MLGERSGDSRHARIPLRAWERCLVCLGVAVGVRRVATPTGDGSPVGGRGVASRARGGLKPLDY